MTSRDELHERLIMVVEHYKKTIEFTNTDYKHHSISRLESWLENLRKNEVDPDMIEWVRNLAKFHKALDKEFAEYLESLCPKN